MRKALALGTSLSLILSTTFLNTSVAKSAPKSPVQFCKTTTAVPHDPIYVTPPTRVLNPLPSVISLSTNCGTIEITTVGQLAPITLTVLATLVQSGFYDNSLCHRVTTEGIFIIQCGDPTATGTGTLNFRYADENLPIAGENNYPAGTVGMANFGPNTNGSQFFISYKDSTIGPNYSIWGKVTKGLKILERVADQGTVSGNSDGFPKQTFAIESSRLSFPKS